MGALPLEVADIFRHHWTDYLSESSDRKTSVTSEQLKVKNAIVSCRTVALGGHLYRCDSCGHQEQSYNSCRNRHCPKCQGRKAFEWVEKQTSALLPVQYFHTVFTLPHIFNPLILQNQNKKVIYEILFTAVQRTLKKVGKNNYQCEIGFFSLLHTWGQKLDLHPHIHCVIPGVGLSLDGKRAITFKENYFVSDKILSSVFRGIFISLIKRAFKVGKLIFEGNLQDLISSCFQQKWVVRSKPPFAGPETVIKYLARYTQKIAISNKRLLCLKDGVVSFSFKDYKNNSEKKTTSLSATEFIRRVFLHVLPSAFVRVRHSGFLANSKLKHSLAKLRLLLVIKTKSEKTLCQNQSQQQEQKTQLNTHRLLCPHCKLVNLTLVAQFAPITSKHASNSSASPPPQLVPLL